MNLLYLVDKVVYSHQSAIVTSNMVRVSELIWLSVYILVLPTVNLKPPSPDVEIPDRVFSIFLESENKMIDFLS